MIERIDKLKLDAKSKILMTGDLSMQLATWQFKNRWCNRRL